MKFEQFDLKLLKDELHGCKLVGATYPEGHKDKVACNSCFQLIKTPVFIAIKHTYDDHGEPLCLDCGVYLQIISREETMDGKLKLKFRNNNEPTETVEQPVEVTRVDEAPANAIPKDPQQLRKLIEDTASRKPSMDVTKADIKEIVEALLEEKLTDLKKPVVDFDPVMKKLDALFKHLVENSDSLEVSDRALIKTLDEIKSDLYTINQENLGTLMANVSDLNHKLDRLWVKLMGTDANTTTKTTTQDETVPPEETKKTRRGRKKKEEEVQATETEQPSEGVSGEDGVVQLINGLIRSGNNSEMELGVLGDLMIEQGYVENVPEDTDKFLIDLGVQLEQFGFEVDEDLMVHVQSN